MPEFHADASLIRAHARTVFIGMRASSLAPLLLIAALIVFGVIEPGSAEMWFWSVFALLSFVTLFFYLAPRLRREQEKKLEGPLLALEPGGVTYLGDTHPVDSLRGVLRASLKSKDVGEHSKHVVGDAFYLHVDAAVTGKTRPVLTIRPDEFERPAEASQALIDHLAEHRVRFVDCGDSLKTLEAEEKALPGR